MSVYNAGTMLPEPIGAVVSVIRHHDEGRQHHLVDEQQFRRGAWWQDAWAMVISWRIAYPDCEIRVERILPDDAVAV
jgi:hypothetical protein